jgi:hypothetical protein
MKNDKRPKRSKDTRSAREIKNALERTPDNDLLDELFRRGLIMRAILFKPTDPIFLSAVIPPELGTRLQDPAPGAGNKAVTNAAMGFRQRPGRKELREHLRRTPVRPNTGDTDEDIARLKASTSRHREYVGQLLDLLSRKRLDKMKERGIERTDVTPEVAHLGTNFFVNPPLASFSGALTPVEAMPKWLQPLSVVNPIYHFTVIARAVLFKGSGLVHLWPNFIGLFVITLILFSLSVWRFRKQLS